MNKTTTARSLYGAKHLGVFDQWGPCSGAGLRAHKSIRGQGHNLRRRRFGEKTHFLFLSLCCGVQHIPFSFSWEAAQSQPGKRWLSPFATAFLLCGWHSHTFRFPFFFAFLDTNGSDALCLFSSSGFVGGIF